VRRSKFETATEFTIQVLTPQSRIISQIGNPRHQRHLDTPVKPGYDEGEGCLFGNQEYLLMAGKTECLRTLPTDLGGTLTDPKPGVTNCIRRALEQLGRPAPYADDLTPCIDLMH
jgi:hypothetical protein